MTAIAMPSGQSAAAPPGKTVAAAAAQHPLPMAQAQSGAITSEIKLAPQVARVPAAPLKPGTLIPSDLRAIRATTEFPPQQKFGYSWRHDFGDTKYRKVSYSAVATTRFAEYFPIKDPTQLTRSAPAVAVDVPSSARPPRPSVLYVIPTFGWQEQTELKFEKGGAQVGPISLPGVKGTGTLRQRTGGGLRIYLDRPWYGSGDGELLGVIVWPSQTQALPGAVRPEVNLSPAMQKARGKAKQPTPVTSIAALATGPLEVPDALKHLVTQWGMDPIWQANPLPQDLPQLENFKNVVKTGTGLTLEEMAGKPEPSPGFYRVSVAGYKPEYDQERRLWYCDIEIAFGASYFPFIRMALARYQPISVEDAFLSQVVLADYAQLTPYRYATVIYDPKNPKKIDVAIAGVTYQSSQSASGPSVVEVSVETKPVGADADLGWIPVPEATLGLGAQPSAAMTVWRGEIRLDRYKVPKRQELRLVVREYESFLGDARGPQKTSAVFAPSPSEVQCRLVYADVLKIPPLL
jgi:hypothetical protein